MKNDDILVLPMDMTDYSSHQPAFQKILDTFGRVRRNFILVDI